MQAEEVSGDRLAGLRSCVGCGAAVVDADGPTHRYVVASAGCWARFGTLGARWWTLPAEATRPGAQRLSVDAYMVQHPGMPADPALHRPAAQSVAIHLVGLCLSVDQGAEPDRVMATLARMASRRRAYPALDPPSQIGDLTVVDVAEIPDAELGDQVERWAMSTWCAWAPHHDLVRAWARGSDGERQ